MITVKSLASSSLGNAYVIDDGETSLLLECGIPWKKIQQKMDYRTYTIFACLVTHLHKDHCRAIEDVSKNGIKVYASPETFKDNGVYFNGDQALKHGVTTTIGSWKVVPFNTEHDCAGSLGFLLKNKSDEYALFLTDTAYSKFTFPPLHTIIIEANFSLDIVNENIRSGRISNARKKRLIETHLSVERTIELLQANDLSQCKAIHLIHLSNDNSDEALFKSMVQEETGIPTIVEDE